MIITWFSQESKYQQITLDVLERHIPQYLCFTIKLIMENMIISRIYTTN